MVSPSSSDLTPSGMSDKPSPSEPSIGIDFGGTSIKMAVVQDGKVVARGRTIHTHHHPTVSSFLDAMSWEAKEVSEQFPKIRSIGIGLPGIVDSVNGIVHNLTNVPGWKNIPIKEEFEKRTGCSVTIENDANAMTYGEWAWGAGRGKPNVLCLTLGTGVGGGLIIENRLYRGSQLAAGEVGHMSIDWRGVPDSYGNFGALEKYVGNRQIAERAMAMYKKSGKEKSLESCAPDKLAAAAEHGDWVAREIWEETGSMIGICIANIQWLLNLDRVVIGGGVAQAGALLFEPILKAVGSRTIDVIHDQLEIIPAQLGTDAGIIGNAVLALEYVNSLKS